MHAYDAFISYSHAKDKPIAAALQSAVQKLGKPWYARRALRLFRDDTSLSATPHLWPTIEQALGQSRFFLLLASPEAAASKWVNKEVAYWLEHNSIETLLIGVTDGELSWDDATGDFAAHENMPLPPVLSGRFGNEPKWVDLRAYRDGADKSDAKFTELAADFAATIRGMPKEDLLSQEVRQQRRALTLAWSAAAGLLALAVVATMAGIFAYRAEQEAIAQRNRAERTLAAATETANSLVTDLAVRLRGVVGIPTALVQDILERARKLQDQLIGSGETSLELRRSQSRALNQSAITLSTLGDSKGALALAQQAAAILRELLAVQPDNTEWQLALASSFSRIGDALWAIGNADPALASYREGLAILRSLVARDPDNTHWQRDLGTMHVSIGFALEASQADEALASYREALAIRKALAAKEPTNTELQLDLSHIYGSVSYMLIDKGQLEEALALARDRLDLASALVTKDTSGYSAQWQLFQSHKLIAIVYKNQGKFDAALAAFRDGRAVAKLLSSDPNNTEAQGALLNMNERIGDLLYAVRKYDEALAAYQDAHDSAKTLVAKDPNKMEWQRDLAVSTAHIGDILQAQSKLDDALAAFREAKTILHAVAAKAPSNLQVREMISFVAYRIGDVLVTQKKLDEATAAYDECVTIGRALIAKARGRLDWQRTLALCLGRMGSAMQEQDKLEEALASYQESKSLFADLTKKDPSNNWWWRDLQVAHRQIGDVLFSAGRFEEATGELRAAFLIAKTLLASEPANSLWQDDRRAIIEPLANALLALAKPEEALTYLDEPAGFADDDAVIRWHRARAGLYGGRVAAAVDDFTALVKLRPQVFLAVTWLHVARMRAGQDDTAEVRANAQALDRSRWPWPIVAFQAGLDDSATVMTAAETDGNERNRSGQICQAEFFVGVDHLDRGRHGEARRLLEAAVKTCPAHYFERAAAVMELKRLPEVEISQTRQ